MNKADFSYNDNKYFVQCNNEEKMKEIIMKFFNKLGGKRKNLFFLYNGQIINEELTFIKCANSLDKSRNYMNILVIEGQDSDDDSSKLIKSKYIICPQCNENALMSIKDFKMIIHGCKNGHTSETYQINEFNDTQLIDRSKIKCSVCENLKCETKANVFYVCHTCKQNLCPKCKDIHDEKHNVIDYDDNNFYCNVHCDKFKFYCEDCKKDLCISCKNEHENHKLIIYDNIIPDNDSIKKNQLKDTKEKIYQLKTIINEKINHLNKLNKNLDIYFDIYNNIIKNFDEDKKNYSIIKNMNDMIQYNSNFIGNITEILKDDNNKSQFVNVMNMQYKMEFKNGKDTQSINKKEEIIQDKTPKDNHGENDNNEEDIPPYDFSKDKYENFQFNQIKELKSYKAQYEILKLEVLNDGRIFTIQKYRDEEGKKHFKLCVYSILNEFICDINIDFEEIKYIFKTEDGNLVLLTKKETIMIIKILKNIFKKLFNLEGIFEIKRISNNRFFIDLGQKTGKMIIIPTFTGDKKTFPELEYHKYIYLYEKGKLILEKNITDIYKKEKALNICLINENEYVLFCREKITLLGEYDFLKFYDATTNTVTKKVKLGKKDPYNDENYDMFYAGGDNLMLQRPLMTGEKFILVDINNKNIKKEYDYIINPKECFYLNEKIFLTNNFGDVYLYEFEDSNNIKLKDEKKNWCFCIKKYPGNKLLRCKNNTISIYA